MAGQPSGFERLEEEETGSAPSAASPRATVGVDTAAAGEPGSTVEVAALGTEFSWREFCQFVGPGVLMSIAYVDPANFVSDLVAGVNDRCTLLWVLLWATAGGLVIQCLAVRTALATGHHLAEHCRFEYGPRLRLLLWLLAEVTVVASDIPEVIGTGIALRLLTGLPVAWGIVLTCANSMLFLAAGSYGIRRMEAAMAALVAVMSCCWLVELLLAHDWHGAEVAAGLVVPRLKGGDSVFVSISLLGAVIMPHNLYLHSGAVLSRRLPPGDAAARAAIRYYNVESALALAVTLFVNCAVVIVGAAAVSSPLMTPELREQLLAQPLQNAPAFLQHVLGRGANGAFAVALLASGQSSTITGVFAGEFVMGGFIDLRVPRAMRSLLTRLAAIVPALVVTLAAGERGSERAILVCSVLLSVLLPFALIPLVKFATAAALTGAALALGARAKAGVWLLVAAVVGANAFLLAGQLAAGAGAGAASAAVAAYIACAAALAWPPVRQRYAPDGGCALEAPLLLPDGAAAGGDDAELRLVEE